MNHPLPSPPAGSPKPVIGLVGGIGSGKSLVARQFASLGCAVIDADELAREVLRQPRVIEQVRRRWGAGVIGATGQVDRRALGQAVFDDPGALEELEALVHPQVLQRRAELLRQYLADPAVPAVVDDTPLLLEKGLDGHCTAVVFVEASRATRLERVRTTRGWDEAELARRESRQCPLDSKARRADYVVRNDADPARCLAQVRRVLSQLLTPPS